MIDFEQVAKTAILHLRSGAVQEADNLLTSALTEHAADQAVAAGMIPAPPPPRAANKVLLDLLGAMVALHGTPYKLETLLAELDQVL